MIYNILLSSISYSPHVKDLIMSYLVEPEYILLETSEDPLNENSLGVQRYNPSEYQELVKKYNLHQLNDYLLVDVMDGFFSIDIPYQISKYPFAPYLRGRYKRNPDSDAKTSPETKVTKKSFHSKSISPLHPQIGKLYFSPGQKKFWIFQSAIYQILDSETLSKALPKSKYFYTTPTDKVETKLQLIKFNTLVFDNYQVALPVGYQIIMKSLLFLDQDNMKYSEFIREKYNLSKNLYITVGNMIWVFNLELISSDEYHTDLQNLIFTVLPTKIKHRLTVEHKDVDIDKIIAIYQHNNNAKRC